MQTSRGYGDIPELFLTRFGWIEAGSMHTVIISRSTRRQGNSRLVFGRTTRSKKGKAASHHPYLDSASHVYRLGTSLAETYRETA